MGTYKQVEPDFKGRRLSSTTLVCRAGGCPLLNDAKTLTCYNLTERGKEKRKEKETGTDHKRMGPQLGYCPPTHTGLHQKTES